MQTRTNKIIFISLLTILIVCLTIGYAVLSSKLNISGSASVNGGRWDVVFLKDKAKTIQEGKATCEIGPIENSSIKDLSVILVDPGDSCTFTIPIKNNGTLNAYLTEVEGKDNPLTFDSTSQSDIEMIKSLVNYEVKYGQIQINSQTDFKKIPFLEEKETEVVTLRAYIPTTAQFTNKDPVQVKIGGFDRTFIFNSNPLEGSTPEEEAPEVKPNAPVLNGDMVPVYYDQDAAVWKKADINNADNNWYDYANQKWANAVTIENVGDLSSNKYPPKLYNGAYIDSEGAHFDGVDDYIDTGLKFSGNSITLVLRLKFNSLPSTEQFRLFENGSIGLYYNKSNQFKFFCPGRELALGKEANLNDYYTIVGTYDGSMMSIYVNGEQSVESISLNLGSKNNFLIGGRLSGGEIIRHSNIIVTDALVFNKALSEEEIMQHYIGKVTLGTTEPMLYYNFVSEESTSDRKYFKNAPVGTEIPEENMNSMWVWIPRYSYTIKSEDGGINYFGKATDGNSNPTRELPGEIDIKFIPTNATESGSAQYSGITPKKWRTNEAFNFDGVNRPGIWVSKFEVTGESSQECYDTKCDVSKVRSMPGNTIIINKSNADFFYMARSMQVSYSNVYGFDKNSGDLHMIKNDEWGAVAYLSQSKYGKYGNSDYSGINKKIYVNSCPDYKAGRSNGDTTGVDGGEYHYNDLTNLGEGRGQAGPGASTTGTIYGVYDMNGGGYERVMALIGGNDGPYVARPKCDNGFNGLATDGTKCSNGVALPDKKYYNLYKTKDPTSDSFNKNADTACSGDVCFGHALSETYGSADGGEYGWYDDYVRLGDIASEKPWMVRGGRCNNDHAGIFNISNTAGNKSTGHSTRFILTP